MDRRVADLGRSVVYYKGVDFKQLSQIYFQDDCPVVSSGTVEIGYQYTPEYSKMTSWRSTINYHNGHYTNNKDNTRNHCETNKDDNCARGDV